MVPGISSHTTSATDSAVGKIINPCFVNLYVPAVMRPPSVDGKIPSLGG
jgi:hypothetical protein